MDEDEDVVLGDIPLKIDNSKPRTGKWLDLHSMESDFMCTDDEWCDAIDTLKASLGPVGSELRTDVGHFGGKPCWLQSYFLDDEYLEPLFVGQLSPYTWGDDFDWIMAYVCAEVRNGEELVHCIWETT